MKGTGRFGGRPCCMTKESHFYWFLCGIGLLVMFVYLLIVWKVLFGSC